jgi:dTDP-4-dehydrorhamnose reductase
MNDDIASNSGSDLTSSSNNISTKESILGTGLSGLVGSGLVSILSDRYQFHNLDLTNGVNILEPKTLEKAYAEHPSPVLIHLAAFTDVNSAQEQMGQKDGSAYQVNVTGTRNVAELCAKHNMHLIHLSTGYVFDGEKRSAYSEDDAVNPVDWYSVTKTEAEKVVLDITPNATIFRINFPYRQDEFPKKDIWHKLAEGLQAGKTGPFFEDHFFTLTPVEWFAQVVDWAITTKPAGIFHATTDQVYTDLSLAQSVAQELGLSVKNLSGGSVHEYNKQANRPYQPSLILSNEKLKQAMGDRYPDGKTS